MNTAEFDYDTFLDGLESVDRLSNNTISPRTTSSTENDSDYGIAHTPMLSTGLDNTVINLDDLDIFPLNMESPLSDDQNGEFNHFSALFDETNPLMSPDNSTFENLFSNFDLPVEQNQEKLQQTPSSQLPIILPKLSDIPPIQNCIKLQSYTNTTSTGPKFIKLEPNNPNIRIINPSRSISFANLPVIKMPLATNDLLVKQNDRITTPPIKRRRSDSPTNNDNIYQKSTLTLDQLKLQYRNMTEEALKKHLRMIKNRESASLSRKRRKDLMENLDVQVKQLKDENEELKRQNSKLLTRIHTLEMENEILKKYKIPNSPITTRTQKPLILMGILLLVVFNVFTLKSLSPISNQSSNPLDLYNNEGAIVPSRTILSHHRTNNDKSYINSNEHDYGPDGTQNYNDYPSVIPNYPYIQCVAYINKTHSQRINRDLHSWVQDHNEKSAKSESVIIPDPKSLSLPSNEIVRSKSDSSIEPLQHISRKVARETKYQSESKGHIQPYKTYEANYDDFIETLDRKNDTLYFVSFKRDHLIIPAKVQKQVLERPCHFNIQDYEKFGECICKSLKQYLDVLHDSTRLESIFLDITKNVLHRLDKNKIPFGLLPSLYPEEKQLNQSVISINSVSNCLEILTQCHEIINDQDASSSSDSDSDPEGGELPDIPYSKEKAITKKKSKKKRTDKSNEEHLQKSNRKRQVNRSKSMKLSKLGKNEYNNDHQIRVSYPFTSEVDINSQLKLSLAVDQMDKTTRMIPERGSLFISKYAKRSGHGLPIFTTERALERRSQKNNSLLQDINYDQQLSDECDTDIGTGIYLTKSNRSQIDNSNVIDKNLHIKRTSSLVSYPHNELVNSSSNQIMTNNISLQTPIFQNLPQRRLKILHRFQQENTKSLNRNEIDQINNISPSIITMPHFMEFTRRLSRSSSINDNDITTIDTQIDSNTFNSYKIHETPILHTKNSINNSNINLKRRFSQKLNNHLLKQPLTSIDYIIKERPINSIQDNNYQNQSNETQRLNQILKKQFYLPFEKNKRL
ncbi:unnamed protein product [Rotaria sordida]|uniref:BZIP domain-containing protein n=1 Tax=Rotaria sordida TaxID=392033 RepID=A0A814K6A6_9BILA|nr:unnamed protein product [Rotaria sordida]